MGVGHAAQERAKAPRDRPELCHVQELITETPIGTNWVGVTRSAGLAKRRFETEVMLACAPPRTNGAKERGP